MAQIPLRMIAFLCFPSAVLAQQQSPLPELPADIPKDAVVRMMLTDKTPSGQDAVWKSPDGTIHEFFQFNDRGRGPKIYTSYRLDSHGLIVFEQSKGVDYMKAPVEERFSLVGGEAVWKNKSEDEKQSNASGRFFIDLSGGPGFILPLTEPQGIVADAVGNLYIAERGDLAFFDATAARIRKATVVRSTGLSAPRILPSAVINAANFAPVPVSPGELVTLFGTDLGPPTGASAPRRFGADRYEFSGRARAVRRHRRACTVRAIVPGQCGRTVWRGAEGQRASTSRIQRQVIRSHISVVEAAPAVFLLHQPSQRGG